MKVRLLLLGSAISACLAAPAYAQDRSAVAKDGSGELEEIIVTAQVRREKLRDVPVSVSALDRTEIQDKNVQRMADIQYFVPNFKMTDVGITTSIFIRGIGSGENQGFEQSVGLYIDGVHYGRARHTQAPFLDVAGVEVLRGPQSILFGKNSVAGALSISTGKPTRSFEGSVMTSYEFNARDASAEGYVSGPLSDRVRARLAARYRHAEGSVVNTRTNERNTQRDEFAIRGTVDVDLTENLTATLKAENSKFDRDGRSGETFVSDPVASGPFAGMTYGQILFNVFGQDRSVLDEKRDDRRGATGEFSRNKLQTYAAGFDWRLGDYTVTSKAAFTRLRYRDNCDCDFIGADILSAGFQETFDQTSEELRLISPRFDRFDFILGAYYEKSTQDYADQIVIASNSLLVPLVNAQAPGGGSLISNTQAARTAKVDGEVLSGFAQVNWRIVPDLTLQLGGRYTHETKDGQRNLTVLGVDGKSLPAAQAAAPLVYAGLFGITSDKLAGLGPQGAAFVNALGALPVAGALTNNRFSPDVKLKWDVASNSMLYASWARGYKSGGFDFRANNRSISPTMAASFQFKDEQATNYEIGGKFTLGRRISVNVAAFNTRYQDLQVAIYDGILGYNVGNAAKARVKGVELDSRWAVTSSLKLSGSAAFTDFKFTDYPNGQCYFGQAPTSDFNGDGVPDLCSYNGRSNQLVSHVEGTLTAEWSHRIAAGYLIDVTGDLFFKSHYDASPLFDPRGRQPGYQLVNLRAALSPEAGRSWQLALVGQNLFDKHPITYAGALPLASGLFGSDALTGEFLQGRQVSVQARLNF